MVIDSSFHVIYYSRIYASFNVVKQIVQLQVLVVCPIFLHSQQPCPTHSHILAYIMVTLQICN